MDKVKSPFSVRRRLHSFIYAFRGLKVLFTEEHNSWIHACAALCSIAAGFILKISLTEWCFLCFAIGLVFTAECINSAIENTVDLYTDVYSPKAEKAKDLAAAGVLITAIVAVIIGLIIFIPKIILLFK